MNPPERPKRVHESCFPEVVVPFDLKVEVAAVSSVACPFHMTNGEEMMGGGYLGAFVLWCSGALCSWLSEWFGTVTVRYVALLFIAGLSSSTLYSLPMRAGQE